MKLLPPPGPARTRQLALLGVLLIGAAYALSRLGTGVTPAAPPLSTSNIQAPAKTAPVPAAKAAAASNGMPQALKLEQLEPVQESPTAARDPFRFGVRPPPPAPPPPPYVPPPPPPPVRPSGPPPPVIPPIPLKFIGRVVLPDKKVVAQLWDGKGSNFKATEGEIVDGRYRLVRIGEESLVIEHLDGTGRTTLPLRGL
jgi:hypothetical protein